MMFLFWHIRAVSACKHEPFDCTVDFPPVTAGGSAYQDARPHGPLCPSHEGTRSCSLFVFWGVLIFGGGGGRLDQSLFV